MIVDALRLTGLQGCVIAPGTILHKISRYGLRVLLLILAVFSAIASDTALAGSYPIYGPQTFLRPSSTPVIESIQFSAPAGGAEYTLNVYNGGLQDDDTNGELVSSGSIKINGTTVVSSNNFNQNVSSISHTVSLQQTNTLEVTLKGKPGGTIVIEILGIDDQPPTIVATAQPGANAAGWHNSPVAVTFTCSDALSGVEVCPDPVTVNTDAANQQVTGTATDKAGNTASASLTLNIDSMPPVAASGVTPIPNAFGWHNMDVIVDYTCSDALSGVVSCPPQTMLTSEGDYQSTQVVVMDIADNTATVTTAVSIDKTAPTVTAQPNPAPNSNGWNNTSVSINYTCSDNLSGVDVCSEPVTVNTEGAGQQFNGSAVDKAGNSATASVAVNVDLTPPTIAVQSPQNGEVISNTSPAIDIATSDNNAIDISTLSFTLNGASANASCTAAGASGATCVLETQLTEGPHSLVAAISDVAGNSASSSVLFDVLIDTDADGVADSVDQCPDTQPGVTVGPDGCPLMAGDEDGDGVADSSDLCPGSGPGVPVDAQGCTSAQSAMQINVTEPVEGQIVQGDRVFIAGAYVSTPNSGITVNGVQAISDLSGNFMVEGLPIGPGVNTLSFVLTDTDGNRITKSVNVSSLGGQPLISAAVKPGSGIAPLSVSLDYTVAEGVIFQELRVDFDGDGVSDTTTSDPNLVPVFTFTNAGIYAVDVTVIDTNGNEHNTKALAEVLDLAGMDILFKSIWDGMNQALINGDKQGGLNYILPRYRYKYDPIFSALLTDFPNIVGSYSEIQQVAVASAFGEYAVNRVINGENKIFFLYFMKDAAGIWRIHSM